MGAHHCSLLGPPLLSDGPHPAMDALWAELEGLPQLWRTVLIAPDAVEHVVRPGERVLVLAAGRTTHAARAFAALRESRRTGATDALAAGDPRVWRDWDRVIAVSREGNEPELLHALEHLPAGVPRVAVTTRGDTPLAGRVDAVLDLGEAASRGVLSFETALLVMSRRELGDEVDSLPAHIEAVMAGDVPLPVPGVDHVIFIGSSWALPLAGRAAQSLAVLPEFRAEAHPQSDIRYGALDHAGPSTMIWCYGPTPPDSSVPMPEHSVIVASRRDPLVEHVAAMRMLAELGTGRNARPEGQPARSKLSA